MGVFDGKNRREFLRAAMATGAAGIAATLSSWAGPIIERAYAADPAGMGGLGDIEHFVLLMQENRSFDHYFGTYSGVRGFADPSSAWQQYGYSPGIGPTPQGFLLPFRLDTTRGPSLDGECVNDPNHSWSGMHQAWNGGRNDQWLPMSIAMVGAGNGPAVMGYYTRADIPVHHELAEAFTLCDGYHCSVLGPTDPNRLYWISATIDPDGRDGGPQVMTNPLIRHNAFSWPTMPDHLSAAGVSWKIYNNRDVGPLSEVFLDGMLSSFRQAADPDGELAQRGKQPLFPADFAADVAAATLPAVSWVIPPLLNCEHPALPPAFGAVGIMQVLDILTSNPAVWEKTALIVSYDENGGFFDHVTPPTPPPGTPGEYLTVDARRVWDAKGVSGPIGLGYRVPCLVVSPYSRGGLVASETFDHTSQLRLLETRFGVEVPNLTPWRRSITGDMTSAFDFASPPDPTPPPVTDPATRTAAALAQCGPNAALGTATIGIPYPVPANSMPTQQPGIRRRPSGLP